MLLRIVMVYAVISLGAIAVALIMDYVFDVKPESDEEQHQNEEDRKAKLRLEKEREAADHQIFYNVERFRHDFDDNR